MPVVTPDGIDDFDALDIPTVSRRSKIGRSFVYDEIRAGRLIAHKYGRLTRILRRDYEAWLTAAPLIVPAPPSANTMSRPNPEPKLDPIKMRDDRPSCTAGTIDNAAIGHNRRPPLDLINKVGRRGVRPRAHR